MTADDARVPWRDVTAVVLLGLALYLPGIGPERGLWNPDEPRFGEVAREMVARGELATPLLNGEPYSNKPPLLFWSIAAASLATGGVDERTARLPSTFAAAALLGVVFVLAWRTLGRRGAWFTALVLGTAFRFTWQAGWVQTDMLLALFTTVALAGYARAMRLGRVDGLGFVALYGGAALGTLTKGLPGIVLPGLVAFVDVTRRRAWRELLRYRIPTGTLLVVAIVGPWMLAMHLMHGPSFLDNLVIKQHFERYVDAFDHRSGPTFYFVAFAYQFLPWSLVVPAAAILVVQDRRFRRELVFPLLWFVSIFLFFTISTSKRGHYLLPAYPAAAMVIGSLLERFAAGRIAPPDARWISGPLRLGLIAVYAAAALAPLALLGTLVALHVGGSAEAAALLEGFVPTTVTASVVLLLVFGAGVLLARRGRPGVVAGAALAAIGTHLVLRSVVLPAFDVHKSARPFVRTVQAALPESGELGAFRFWRGYLNFYLEQERMPVFWGPEEAARFLDEPGSACLIVRERYLETLEGAAGRALPIVARDRIGSKKLVLACDAQPDMRGHQ